MTMVPARFAIAVFSLYAKIKGYTFSPAHSGSDRTDADELFRREGYKLTEELEQKMERYRAHTINFIARYKGKVVGTIGLADPKVVNRPFELLGIDEHGAHYEIQRLVVSKQHRNCSHLVLLGLFREMYNYSMKHKVRSWISFGVRQLYVGLRRYSNKMSMVSIGLNFAQEPLSEYLLARGIIDTCAVIRLDALGPAEIFLRFIRKRLRS